MSAAPGWKALSFYWSLCVLVLGLVATPSAAQDPTAQTAKNNIEALGVIPASQPLAGLGFNIDTTNEWEFSLAASAGTTHVRFQCSWVEIEAQTSPPMNASGGYGLSPNCAKALTLSKKYGMHPTVIAAFGAPFHQILTVTVPNGGAAGDYTLQVQFAAGTGGDTFSALAAFSDALISTNGNQLSSRNSYAGDLIVSVNQTDETHATLTLASALTSGLPANNTSTYTINEYLVPPAATSGANDPSVTAYANYAHFLAQSIAAAGLTGEVEIWNEPPWSSDPWDARQNFYDVFPGPSLPGPLLGNEPNWGFAAALSRPAYAVPGVAYVWAGTNKSADNSLLAPGMLLNTGSLFVQPVTNVRTESIHPYGNNPEDDIWSETCVKNSILPNPLRPLYFTRCNLDSNSTSNVVELEQLNLIAKFLNPNNGIAHSITETGFSLSDGDLAHEARFVMRQFLAYQAVGVTPVEFYRLYDTSPDDLTLTNLSTNAPLPAFTAISGLMADIATIKGSPVTPVTPSNLPSVVSYGGFFALDTVSIVGSRPGDTSNSEVFAVWQRSHVTGGAKWGTMASPVAVPVTIAVPTGSMVASVINLDTRASVAFTANGQQITFAVSDDPIEVLVEPSAPAPTVISISIAPATASVGVGGVLSFTCTATLSDETTSACASAVYTSSNPGVASISGNAVTGVAPGSATITASIAGVPPASALLTVTAPVATLASIAITPATASVAVGGLISFTCTATLSDGTTSACASPVYTSSNPGVASISSNVVTGAAPGAATITASVAGVPPASALLTVIAPAPTLSAISIAPGTASVVVGGVLNFSCTATLSDGTTAACASPVYSSSNPGVASTSGSVATGVAPGSATITASLAGVPPASALLTVNAPAPTLSSISIAPGNASVLVGGMLTFTCVETLSNGTAAACASPVYSSSNPSVASNSGGSVTGVAPGSVTITASVAGASPASALLVVIAPVISVKSISIAPATASIVAGGELSFVCTETLSDGTTSVCTSPAYSSSNSAIAALSSDVVTGIAPGLATITASVVGAPSASALLTVTAPATTVKSISIAPTTASVAVGAVLNFSCTATSSDGTTSVCVSPIFTSSNSNIALGAGSAFTGVAPGVTSITAAVAGAPSASAILTVTAPAITVRSISIAPAMASLVVGAALNFSCTATLSDGTTSACASPVFTSSNPNVALGAANAFTGVAPGSATIMVTIAGVPSASALLTVTTPATTLRSISIAPAMTSVVVGAVTDFSCTATFSDGTTSVCTSPIYDSSNPSIVSVSGDAGTGLAPGLASITASVSGVARSAPAVITVTAPAVVSGVMIANPATGDTYGVPVTLTETVPAVGGACSTSKLSFSNGAVLLGVVTLVGTPGYAPTSCVATVTTTSLPVGVNEITGTSSADGIFGAISSEVTVSVAAAPGTGDTLSVGPTTSIAGSPVTAVFKLRTVPGAGVAATGSVVFTSKGSPLGTGILATTGSGAGAVTTATLVTTSLEVGNDTVQGVYLGDQNYGPATPTAIETVTAKKGNPTIPATITLSGLVRTYNGSAQGVAVATVPSAISYAVTYSGSSNMPTDAGSYAIVATITDSAYSAQPATGTFTIAKEESKLNWTPYTTVSSPDLPIGANVLNAQCSAPGQVSYTAQSSTSEAVPVTPTTSLATGQYTLSGVCTPTDGTDYASSSESIPFLVINDSIFVANLSGEVAAFFDNGIPQGPNSAVGGLGVAVDLSGNVWSINAGGNSVSKLDKTGAMLSVSSGGGLDAAKALAVDGAGRVWVVNGGGTISALGPDGTPASANAYATAALENPSSISIDFKGSVWIANQSSNSITEVIGVASPTVTPLIAAQTQH